MARYTIELGDVVRYGNNIFDFDYDFFDPQRKPEFERNFIRHFYFREICTEPIERFKVLLEDKMKTVFPYYNELFKTAAVEYSILDNYDIRETTTLKRENVGASSGESYSTGKILNEQETETNEDRTRSQTEKANSEGVRNGSTDTERSETVTESADTTETLDGTKTRDLTETETSDDNIVKKFLDTPQGQVDLKDSKYLTTLNDDTRALENEKKLGGSETDNQTKTVDTDTETTTEGNSKTTTEETNTKTDNVELSGEENAKTTNKFSGEERTTADNNTRTRSEGSTTETIEHTRKGNIGVDTDADMIQKHIKLQKVLTQIEKMFFDECDDLFMLVW